MNTPDPTGKFGKATRIVRDHPVFTGLALFTGVVVVTRTVVRRSNKFDIVELPATDVPEQSAPKTVKVDLGDLGTIEEPADGRRGTDGDDPISKEIRP
ncbi:MAG TPA: hypothetical protein VJ843_03495 [Candidatus Saccharimonadales bacterium]|nr:hypothetical protein [Candidatus Saccharimonadales bacterium]